MKFIWLKSAKNIPNSGKVHLFRISLSLLIMLLGLSLPVQPIHAQKFDSSQETILLVHGWQLTDATTLAEADCQEYWKDVIDYLKPGQLHEGLQWIGKVRTLGYYTGDHNCDDYLHDGSYDGIKHLSSVNEPGNLEKNHCDKYIPTDADPAFQSPDYDGTTNESISHLSCLFAWYVYNNFAKKNITLEIVAHSMGGLIVRSAMYQVQNRDRLGLTDFFPPSLGLIPEVITFGTPHAGVLNLGVFKGFFNQQAQEMVENSPFMQKLMAGAISPQAGNTDWTLISSDCDIIAGNSGVSMPGASQKIIYAEFPSTYIPNTIRGATRPPAAITCYFHTDYFHMHRDEDSDIKALSNEDRLDAPVVFCNLRKQGENLCDGDRRGYIRSDAGPEGRLAMWHALWGTDLVYTR